MVPAVAVTAHVLDIAAIRQDLVDPECGAVVLFEGCPRNNHEGRAVEGLGFEAFVPMAEGELATLREEAVAAFTLKHCIIHHRLGEVPLGEAAVVVACASPHRQEAFAALSWIMDRLKERVPIWKSEHYAEGGNAWVEGNTRF